MQTRLLTVLTAIILFGMPLSAKAAMIFQFDFQVRVTNFIQIGDLSVVGNPTSGLMINDIISGSFILETPQIDAIPLDINRGRYVFSDLVLNLPSGNVHTLPGVPSNPTLDITTGSGGIFLSSLITTNPNLLAGERAFQEDIDIRLDAPGIFSNVNVLDITAINEIAQNLNTANVDYNIAQVEAFVNARGAIATTPIVFEGFGGEIFNASVSQVPEPTAGMLFLMGLGALIRFRHQATISR
jgi:hypothetical protein